MSGAIGPGDWVECIDAEASYGLALRHIYYVVEVAPPEDGARCYRDGCSGHDLQVRGADFFYCAGRFRPVYRPRAGFIESLKAPPQHVRESESA